ncbi:MAG: T9SS type A sorting domain-containing protein, partial [Bacteroidales bacterium]|nr:T9SS type A sorting domain-containing protein [Bacteroidales bacterium]
VHAGGFINSGLPDTLAICGSSSLEIVATAGYATYVWSNGGSLPTNTVSTSGTYFLTIQDAYLCSLEDSVQVSVINATLTASSDTLCEGELVMLTANSGPFDFLWSTGDTDPVIFQNPLEPTDYSVFIEDGISGCYFSVSVFVNIVGTGSISGEMEVIAGDSVYLYTVEGLEGSSFEWLVSGGVVDTIIGDSLWVIWLNEGEGYIQLTEFAANGCTGIPVTLSIDVLDLEEFDKPLIRIYPNPFASKITLEGLKGQEQIELYNVAGQLVLKRIANAPHLQIDATTLPDGVYFLQIQDSGNSTIHSLIKQGR